MRSVTLVLAALLVPLLTAHPADAQERDGGWWRSAILSLVERGDVTGLQAFPRMGDEPWEEGEWGDAEGGAEDRRDDTRERREEYDEERREAARERVEEVREARRERDEEARERREEERERREEWEEDRREYEEDRREAQREYEDERREAERERWEERDDDGPPFCRNGEGHPVHGMEWCLDKGWGRAGSDPVGRWGRVGWNDVILDAPRRGDARLDEPSLMDVLGDVVFGRLVEHGQSTGMRGDVDGRWVRSDAGTVLQLRMGGTPLAEMADADRDGRADVVLLNRR